MRSGTYSICAIALNAALRHPQLGASCRSVTLALSPSGVRSSRRPATARPTASRSPAGPSTPTPPARCTIAVTVDGKAAPDLRAGGHAHRHRRRAPRPAAPPTASRRWWRSTTASTASASPRATSAAAATCRWAASIVNAVHPVAPSAPRLGHRAAAATAPPPSAGRAPASDGGAPLSKYTSSSAHDGHSVTVGGTTTAGRRSTGLKPQGALPLHRAGGERRRHLGRRDLGDGRHAGRPAAAAHARRRCRPAATSATSAARPRPTSRRCGPRAPADASHNPAGPRLPGAARHRRPGPVRRRRRAQRDDPLRRPTATSSRDVDAYVDGYHSAQRASAPVTIALGTNNDMDVSRSSGAGAGPPAWSTRSPAHAAQRTAA